MTFDELKRTLTNAKPPAGIGPPLTALWWAAKGDWDKAHGIVMKEDSRDAAWVHAYLHRVEGDLDNAGYWYRKARRPAEAGPLPAEWDTIAADLIEQARKS
jgi:hypothetical protein